MQRSIDAIRRPLLLAGCSVLALGTSAAMAQTFSPLIPGTVIISSSTYSHTQGPVRDLAIGSVLPDNGDSTPTKNNGNTTTAVAGNTYPAVWDNNAGNTTTKIDGDGSFGVAAAIQLTAIDGFFSFPLWTRTLPPDQVVTSFSSKSELAVNVTRDPFGPHLTLTAYGVAGTQLVSKFGTGVGGIDVSASDAVPNQDITNPVTFAASTSSGAFGYPGYAFARTIIAMDAFGMITYTPTVNYGEDNSRAALLGSNGLYYTVGNSNNGATKLFAQGFSTPDVTETTGLEVVQPIKALTSSVANLPPSFLEGNSAEVNAMLSVASVPPGATVKPGKVTNFRGLTEFGGALWFTKGSGSNGINTLYTVAAPDQLPTVSDAVTTAKISVVPGFPTDPANSTAGANFTPFGVFFANATTLYLADEGSGSTTPDASSHAGLEKWSLVNGTWQLDYVLTNGLITGVGRVLKGPDGQYPEATPPNGGTFAPVTDVGLRNLTGVVVGETVTLWATTSTASSSSDAGADPNKVVRITDILSAKTVTPVVAHETFETVAGPTYGVVYRGVAYVPQF